MKGEPGDGIFALSRSPSFKPRDKSLRHTCPAGLHGYRSLLLNQIY